MKKSFSNTMLTVRTRIPKIILRKKERRLEKIREEKGERCNGLNEPRA